MKSDDMAQFGDLRSILQQPPCQKSWDALCAHIEHWPSRALKNTALPYALSHLEHWPSSLRSAPQRWVDRLMYGQLAPGMALVRRLSLKDRILGPQSVRPIGRLLRHLTIEDLDLTGTEINAEGFGYLMKMPFFKTVKSLNLKGNWMNEAGMIALVSSPHLGALRTLQLGSNLDRQGIDVFCSADLITQLEHLAIDQCCFDYEQIDTLQTTQKLKHLKTLSFKRASRHAMSLDYFFQKLDLDALTSLSLDDVHLGEQTVQYLTQISAPLAHLHLERCGLDFKAIDYFSRTSWPLETLSLPFNKFDYTTGELFSDWSLGALNALDLSYNRLGDEGMWGLTACMSLRGLNHLNLAYCGLGEEGAMTLAKYGAFEHLESLDLSGCPLTQDVIEQMIEAPWLSQLKHLTLSHCDLDMAKLMSLMSAPWASQLTFLDVNKNNLLQQEYHWDSAPKDINLESLMALNLSQCCLGVQNMEGLINHGHMPQLRSLNLSECNLSTGLRHLVRCKTLSKLEVLVLDANRLLPEDVDYLLKFRHAPLLKQISLWNNTSIRHLFAISKLKKQVDVLI